MKPLIDADCLHYEIAYCGQYKEEGELVVRPFEFVAELFEERVKQICDAVWADEKPLLFMTGKGNFRDKIATVKPYKGTRKAEKPFHYKNLKAYIMSHYDVREAEGLEADDLMCVEQTKRLKLGMFDTVICTRDKDLRQCPGMHFGWECGAQAGFPFSKVDELGWVKEHRKVDKEGKEYVAKVSGVGLKFFYAQLLMGDSVDNIPGLPGCGPAKAYEAVSTCKNEDELHHNTFALYLAKYGDDAAERMLEQGRLCWMVRELDENNQPVMWEMYGG